mmetsp:Transcript_41050/g.116412  ORF Transcript_41050/g.116412 Transcript_41050/m.116412 type:complete len:220 (-) Transcript_41050:126-785(-)
MHLQISEHLRQHPLKLVQPAVEVPPGQRLQESPAESALHSALNGEFSGPLLKFAAEEAMQPALHEARGLDVRRRMLHREDGQLQEAGAADEVAKLAVVDLPPGNLWEGPGGVAAGDADVRNGRIAAIHHDRHPAHWRQLANVVAELHHGNQTIAWAPLRGHAPLHLGVEKVRGEVRGEVDRHEVALVLVRSGHAWVLGAVAAEDKQQIVSKLCSTDEPL